MPKTVNARILCRTDTAAEWTRVNPVLASGEFGVETDTNQFKIGNGNQVWNNLPYAVEGGGADVVTQEPSAASTDSQATAASTMFNILGGNRSQLTTDASSLIPAINEVKQEIEDIQYAIGNVPAPGGEMNTGTLWYNGQPIFVQTWIWTIPQDPLGGNFAQMQIGTVPGIADVVRTEVVNIDTNCEFNFLAVRVGGSGGAWNIPSTGSGVWITNTLQTNLQYQGGHQLAITVFYTRSRPSPP